MTFLELLTSFEWRSYFHSNHALFVKKSFLFAVSHTVTYAAYQYTRSTFNWKFNLQWIRFVSLLSSIKTGYYVNYHILTEKYGHSAIMFNEYPHERKPISRGNLIFFEIRFTFFVCLYTFVIINNYYSFVTFFFFVNDLLIKLKVFLFFLDINALLSEILLHTRLPL